MFRMQTTLRLAQLCILSLTTACHDTTGPCASSHACEVHGVDLYIRRLEVFATERDSLTGLAIVDPNPIPIDLAVQNRGDQVSRPGVLVIQNRFADDDTVDIPSLAPGEDYTVRVQMQTWERAGGLRESEADTASVTAELVVQDAVASNNRASSAAFHARVALIPQIVAVTLEDSLIRMNVPFAAHLTIVNKSRHGTLAPHAIGFSLWDLNGDAGGERGFGMRDIPAIAPMGKYETDLTLTVPAKAAWQSEKRKYRISASIVDVGSSDLVQVLFAGYNLPGPTVTLSPDYNECGPAELQADVWVSAPFVCNNPSPFSLFKLRARSGVLYTIEQPQHPGASVYAADGSSLGELYPGQWIRLPSEGTYYIADFLGRRYDIPPASSMRLRQTSQ